MTLGAIEEMVDTTCGPNLDRTSDQFRAAVVMAAPLGCESQDETTVAEWTGYPVEFVREIAARLRSNGIWKDGKIHADWAGKDGGIDFILCSLCASGMMQRA